MANPPPSRPPEPRGTGAILALTILVGGVWGLFNGQATLGIVAGAGIGIGIAVLFRLIGLLRRRS